MDRSIRIPVQFPSLRLGNVSKPLDKPPVRMVKCPCMTAEIACFVTGTQQISAILRAAAPHSAV